jgi:hypothetical protein
METAYITYEAYDRIPSCEDYVYGKTECITLRNKSTDELERITYKLIGAIPFIYRSGYQSFWGEIKSKDRYCCLVFSFTSDGILDSIVASFCGESPTVSEFNQRNKAVTYAAQITAIGDFGPIPF